MRRARARATPPERLALASEALLLGAIVVAPWPYGSVSDAARQTVVAVALAAVTLWLASRALSGDGLPALLPAAAALPGLALLQLALRRSAAPEWTLEAFLSSAAMTGVVVLWTERARAPSSAWRLAVAVLGVCAAEAVFGAMQWSVSRTQIYGSTVTMPFGSYVDHNHFAGLMEMGALLAAGVALGLWRRAEGPSAATLAVGGLALALIAVHLASRSRGGLLALLAGALALAVLALRSRAERPRPWRAALGLGAAAVLLVAAGLAMVPPEARAHLATALRGPTDGSGEYRVDIAAASLRLFAERPILGAGLGAYADAVPAFKRAHGDVRTEHAESDALELLAEGGLAGVAAVAVLGRGLWRGLQERTSTRRERVRSGLALGAAAGGLALVAGHAWLDFNLHVAANALVACSLLGLAGAPRAVMARVGSARASWAAFAAAALLAATAAWAATGAGALQDALDVRDPEARIEALTPVLRRHPMLAAGHAARAQAWQHIAGSGTLAAARLRRARADLESALSLRPRWAEAWFDLAWVEFRAGDRAGCVAALDRAGALDPTHLELGLLRARLRAQLDGPAAGIRELAALRARNPWWTLQRALAAAREWTGDRSLLLALTDGSAAERQVLDASRP